MAKTETQINLKINKGTYAKIQENLSQIGEDELIITDDKNIPVPTISDNLKVLYINNGDYTLGSSTDIFAIEVDVAQLGDGTTTISLSLDQEATLLAHSKQPMQIIVRIGTDRYYFYKQVETETIERYTCETPTSSSLFSYMLQYTKNSGELVLYDSNELQVKKLVTSVANYSSDDTVYPSAKAVYDYCQTLGVPIIAIPNNISSINTSVTISVSNENKAKILGTYGGQCVLDININGDHHLFYKSNDVSQTQMDFICVSNGYIVVAKFNGTDNTSQLTIQSKKEYEYQAHKKTSVSSNSSSDNYYPTTKAVYDFVKGETKYIIVDTATNLPSSNVAEGTLAYVQDTDSFKLYNGSTWTAVDIINSNEPSTPERFSLAYNLVVNINQEQFANGSWTGTNNDNIRTFQYNGSNADETKAKELVEFLTGVNVLDSYNATKPTPCFVFCTQSNICWKLQWDNSLLHAYKVENFPFVVKQKYYRFVLNDNGCMLQLFIRQSDMQDVYDRINQVLGGNISTPQEVVGVYNQLKGDNLPLQTFVTLCSLFTGVYSLGFIHHLPTAYYDGHDMNPILASDDLNADLIYIRTGSISGIFNPSGTTGYIAHSSNANFAITENTDLDFD